MGVVGRRGLLAPPANKNGTSSGAGILGSWWPIRMATCEEPMGMKDLEGAVLYRVRSTNKNRELGERGDSPEPIHQ